MPQLKNALLGATLLSLTLTSLQAQTPAPAQTPPPAPVDTATFIRTPPAPHTPRINGPHIYGQRPGRPFLYHLPTTGDRPLTFSANNLPAGLTLNSHTGNITGTAPKEGRYAVTFTAKNSLGEDNKKMTLVISRTICLTPPLGWNSWNCFGPNIDEAKIRGAADAMVKTGLIEHGWTYINMDDRWEGDARDAAGNIQSSKAIPDMKKLADYIHGLGLKVGLYSSPGAFTCAGAIASYGHEDQDAATYAKWTMDYLKYDWCSYQENIITERAAKFAIALPGSADEILKLAAQQRELEAKYAGHVPNPQPLTQQERDQLSQQDHEIGDKLENLYHQASGELQGEINTACDKDPYWKMRHSLDKVNRDIVFSFCQYGIGNVYSWGAEVGGNTWRTTGDIGPNWPSVEDHGFGQNGLEKWASPGHWNDPDMLEVGNGDLTPDENFTHMTLWCMLASPLLIGCDMPKMSPFTISLFSNDEVLAVSQDSFGKQGYRIKQAGSTEVWIKPLDDGSLAVAFFNRGPAPADVSVAWGDLKLTGKQTVRDLWRQKDMGSADTQYTVNVASHGAELFKIAQGTP